MVMDITGAGQLVADTNSTSAAARLCIPMQPGLRSLNVALAGVMILGETLRQSNGFADERD
jgi:tRNA (cytidine/uridine-2'-O-)-methyltransferase